MSRHELTTRDGRNEAVVGWDRPMQTFFAQVANGKLADIDFENEPLLWVGADRLREVQTVEQLRGLTADYLDISGELSVRLQADKNARDETTRHPDFGGLL